MKLILHIGTEKTGTTSIQSVLNANAEKLFDCGVRVINMFEAGNNEAIPAAFIDTKKNDDYFNVREIFSTEEKAKHQSSIKEKLAMELAKLPAHIKCVIISSELFHSRTNTSSEVERVREFFNDYFDEIDIICYLREQSSLCASLYSTAIKTGSTLDFSKFKNFVNTSNGYYNYKVMLENWEQIFGFDAMKVRLFDKSLLKNNDLIEDFMELALPTLNVELKRPPIQNESINTLGQTIGLAINRAFKPILKSKSIRHLRWDLIHVLSKSCKGKGATLAPEEALSIHQQFFESNQVISRHYFNKSSPLFEKPSLNNNQPIENFESSMLLVFEEIISTILNRLVHLNDDEIDQLRDLATTLEKENKELALILFKIGFVLRPEGDFLKSKVSQIEKALTSQGMEY